MQAKSDLGHPAPPAVHFNLNAPLQVQNQTALVRPYWLFPSEIDQWHQTFEESDDLGFA